MPGRVDKSQSHIDRVKCVVCCNIKKGQPWVYGWPEIAYKIIRLTFITGLTLFFCGI